MLKTRTNGKYSFISEASGPRVTAGNLVIGGVYLHKGLYKTRKILSVMNDGILYMDDIGSKYRSPSFCSDAHFSRVCPTEATPEEIEFLNEEYLK